MANATLLLIASRRGLCYVGGTGLGCWVGNGGQHYCDGYPSGLRRITGALNFCNESRFDCYVWYHLVGW